MQCALAQFVQQRSLRQHGRIQPFRLDCRRGHGSKAEAGGPVALAQHRDRHAVHLGQVYAIAGAHRLQPGALSIVSPPILVHGLQAHPKSRLTLVQRREQQHECWPALTFLQPQREHHQVVSVHQQIGRQVLRLRQRPLRKPIAQTVIRGLRNIPGSSRYRRSFILAYQPAHHFLRVQLQRQVRTLSHQVSPQSQGWPHVPPANAQPFSHRTPALPQIARAAAGRPPLSLIPRSEAQRISRLRSSNTGLASR